MKDTSKISHRNEMPPHERARFSRRQPWFFETADALQAFATPGEAFEAQRKYRIACGFDPVTGERELEGVTCHD